MKKICLVAILLLSAGSQNCFSQEVNINALNELSKIKDLNPKKRDKYDRIGYLSRAVGAIPSLKGIQWVKCDFSLLPEEESNRLEAKISRYIETVPLKESRKRDVSDGAIVQIVPSEWLLRFLNGKVKNLPASITYPIELKVRQTCHLARKPTFTFGMSTYELTELAATRNISDKLDKLVSTFIMDYVEANKLNHL